VMLVALRGPAVCARFRFAHSLKAPFKRSLAGRAGSTYGTA
jgi:hypothetical protein